MQAGFMLHCLLVMTFKQVISLKVKIAQLCPTLCNPMDYTPGQNAGAGSLSLLQVIFPTQGSNSSLLHCRQIDYLSSEPPNFLLSNQSQILPMHSSSHLFCITDIYSLCPPDNGIIFFLSKISFLCSQNGPMHTFTLVFVSNTSFFKDPSFTNYCPLKSRFDFMFTWACSLIIHQGSLYCFILFQFSTAFY